MTVILILLFAGIIFWFVRLTLVLSNRRSWTLEYQSVGHRYLGKNSIHAGVSNFTPLSRPVLNFKYRDAHVTLASRGTVSFPDHKRETRVSIVVPFNMVPLEITTASITDWRWAKDGGRKIVFDQPEFQATFKAASASPVEAKRSLNKEIRWQLEKLRRSSSTDQLRVRISRKSIEIAVPGDLRNCQPIDDFVRMSLKLCDLLAMRDTFGLNFVDEERVVLLESVKCPICSEEIKTEIVSCVRCQTPHCRDCWSYNGECATYACNETRFTEVGNSSQTSPKVSIAELAD